MFGLLNTSQVYGIQQPTPIEKSAPTFASHHNHHHHHHSHHYQNHRPPSSNRLLTSLNSIQGMKAPTTFIEKFIRNEILTGYDAVKNLKNFHHSSKHQHQHQHSQSSNYRKDYSWIKQNTSEGFAETYRCSEDTFRESFGTYSNSNTSESNITNNNNSTEKLNDKETATYTTMTVKCSTDAPPVDNEQNICKSSDENEVDSDGNFGNQPSQSQVFLAEADITPLSSSGASSGEYNESTQSVQKDSNAVNGNVIEITSDNSTSSMSSSSALAATTTTIIKPNSSSTNSPETERRESANNTTNITTHSNTIIASPILPRKQQHSISSISSERAQRRKFIQMISFLDQQNQRLQHDLIKEKRRRTDELSCIVKSLICFESKLKIEKNQINQRMLEKDNEICRLVRQNRALRKQLNENVSTKNTIETLESSIAEDCLLLEALQCINCKTQFYDIEKKEIWTQTGKDGSRINDDHTTEHGSSSDDTVSSSFYGARRSVRYTSKRTFGTFRDYMRSRSMNIDDPNLDNSEENASTISRDDSQNSYEKMNIYSRTIEKMHGVRHTISTVGDEHNFAGECDDRNDWRNNRKVNQKSTMVGGGGCAGEASSLTMDDDDGIFSPGQDVELDGDDYHDDDDEGVILRPKPILGKAKEFCEISPKQEFEISTDDWYVTASDQEESVGVGIKSYGNNPVLECVNQILLQQSMEEPINDESPCSSLNVSVANSDCNSIAKVKDNGNIPRQSSLSGRKGSRCGSNRNSCSSIKDHSVCGSGTISRKRVHFSTKNSMVHVPRNDEDEDEGMMSATSPLPCHQYHPMHIIQHQQQQQQPPTSSVISEQIRDNILNYESIYSNEYEPIGGSEHNSSNLYVDMEAPSRAMSDTSDIKTQQQQLQQPNVRHPPALPPKPANLIKFKKKMSSQNPPQLTPSLINQFTELSDDKSFTSEPDYCSISEVNMTVTSVQIVADVHMPPAESLLKHSDSEEDHQQDEKNQLQLKRLPGVVSELSVKSDDSNSDSVKTDEIEEIFADIPKLPNVAAIIAPKSPKYSQQQQMLTPISSKSEIIALDSLTQKTPPTTSLVHRSPKQFKRKHVPNILSEINKRIAANHSGSTSTPGKLSHFTPPKGKKSPLANQPSALTPLHQQQQQQQQQLRLQTEEKQNSMPLQAEFDWYNLDAEYGKASSNNKPDILKVTSGDSVTNGIVLEEINEFLEDELNQTMNTSTADEYNLDEEFSLTNQPDLVVHQDVACNNIVEVAQTSAAIAAAATTVVSILADTLPLSTESSTVDAPYYIKKLKKTPNFEKFIDSSGLSTKPLPRQRKIYFSPPFV